MLQTNEGFSSNIADMINDNEQVNFHDEPSAKSSLVKVVLYFRHGNRSPNINTEDFNIPSPSWPSGLGALTNLGKMNSYLLGKKLRKRYDTILTPFYSKSNVHAKSTSTERTMVTASIVLAGMYPPKEHQIWNERLQWNPIPVFLDDTPLKSYQCRRTLYEFLKYKPDKMTKALHTVRRYIEENCAYTFAFPDCPDGEIYLFIDSLICLRGYGVSLPDWAETLTNENESLVFDWLRRHIVHSEVQKQLSCNYIAENILNTITRSTNVMLNCVHDINIVMLSSMLGFEFNFFPSPLSCIAVELHDKDGAQTVNTFYAADINSPFKQMEMACGFEPDLDTFKEMLSACQVDDYDALGQAVPEELEFMNHKAYAKIYNAYESGYGAPFAMVRNGVWLFCTSGDPGCNHCWVPK